MRNARTNDVWRALYARNDHPITKVVLEFSGVTELGAQQITVESPIALICGENGVGKSSLLWTLYRALSPNGTVEGMHRSTPPKAPSGNIESITISVNVDREISDHTDIVAAYSKLSPEDPSPPVIFLDPTFQTPELVRTIRADNNFLDLLEGIEAAELDKSSRELIENLVGRSYEQIKIFEIENYADHEIFPYFQVTSSGVTYGSESMGLGELSLLKMFWTFTNIEKPSIVLLEEPETFIAPRSQRTLIDMVAKFCNSKRLFCIISSHSGIIAERVPNTHLSLVTKGAPNVVIARNPSAHLLIERLGLRSFKHAVLLVEDAGAKALLRAILFETNSRLAASCEIAVAGSESEITSALKAFPKDDLQRFRLVGVYDGDAKAIPAVQNAKLPWPQLFLPEDDCPELLIQKHVLSLGHLGAAIELARPIVEVATAFGGAQGKNHHDWLTEVCASLRIPVTEFFDRLAPSWVSANRRAAEALAHEIKEALT